MGQVSSKAANDTANRASKANAADTQTLSSLESLNDVVDEESLNRLVH